MVINKMIALLVLSCIIAPSSHAGGWEKARKYGRYAAMTFISSLAIYGLVIQTEVDSGEKIIILPQMDVNNMNLLLEQPIHGGVEMDEKETLVATPELVLPANSQVTPVDKRLVQISKPSQFFSDPITPVLPLNLKLDNYGESNGGVFFATAVFRPQAAAQLEGLGGTYIGVGSFPPLFHACLGNFTRVFSVDLDSMVYDFSHAHLDIILALGDHYQITSHQRYQYLAIMHNRWFDSEDLEEIEMKSKGRSINFSYIKEKLNKASYLSSRGLLPELPLERAIVELNKVEDRHFRHLAKASKDKNPHEIKWFDREFENGIEALYKQDGFEKVLYSATNNLWIKLLAMARENRIQPVLGDLTGSKDMAIYNISQELKLRHAEPVSALYLSNVVNMLGFKPEDENSVWLENFRTNLEAFPFSKDATVFAICRSGINDDAIYTEVRERGYDVWDYFDFKADEFIFFLKKPLWVFKTYYSSKHNQDRNRTCWVEEVKSGVGPKKAARDCGIRVYGKPSGVSSKAFLSLESEAVGAGITGEDH